MEYEFQITLDIDGDAFVLNATTDNHNETICREFDKIRRQHPDAVVTSVTYFRRPLEEQQHAA